MNSNIIILGDPHIGRSTSIGKIGLGSSLNSRIDDQLNLLDWTLDQAIEHHVDHIVITGDVFEDPKPAPILISLFIGWLKKCQTNDVRVHIVMGNHDTLRTGFIYSSPLDIITEVDMEGVFIYNSIDTFYVGNTAFTMVPFRDRKSFGVATNGVALSLLQDIISYELVSIPMHYKKVLIGHLAIEGSIPVGDEIDDITNELFCPIEMFKGFNFVWMGHVHKPQIILQHPHVAHIGSMDISNFGETDQTKYIVIFNSDTQEWFVKSLPTRTLKKITISIPKGTEDSTGYVINQLNQINNWADATVKLEISLTDVSVSSVNKSVIEKILLDKGIFNIASFSEAKKISLVKKNENTAINTKMDVPAAINTFSETLDPSLRTGFIELAMDIYKQFKAEAKE
jgi:exonuclease SbcD